MNRKDNETEGKTEQFNTKCVTASCFNSTQIVPFCVPWKPDWPKPCANVVGPTLIRELSPQKSHPMLVTLRLSETRLRWQELQRCMSPQNIYWIFTFHTYKKDECCFNLHFSFGIKRGKCCRGNRFTSLLFTPNINDWIISF